jgi:cell division protein ZapD
VIQYEYPFNERIRTLLRLEDLFEKAAHFSALDGAYEHHASLLTMFEMIDVASRADLKLDLIQELERQRQTLLVFRNNPEISEEALSGALYEIEGASAALLAMQGKIGQYLRDNEWLMSIKSRAAIPGGVCEFDVPSYHHWLHRSSDERRDALYGWIKPMMPLRDGLTIVLRLLRSSGRPERFVAKGGLYQLMLSGTASQMVRISLPDESPSIPEISANKYALNVRFSSIEPGSYKPRICERDVDFDMVFCNL